MSPPPPPVPAAIQQTGSGDAVTLLIRHLPEGLPADTLKRLFFHYGASDFRPCEAGRLKNCAFVDFNDEGVAARAQSQLHRLRFLGKILTVERAKPVPGKEGTSQDGAKKENTERGNEMPPLPPYPPPPEEPPLLQATASAQTGSAMTGGEPIAPTLGVDYPFPPHLMYAYPPPDGNILTNIVNTLIAVPRFYTQVLHLMNKMNLPAPFRPALPTPPLPPPVPHPAGGKRQAGDLSSGESELESSDEDNNAEVMDEETERSEKEAEGHQARSKRAKLEAVLGPAVDKGASHEAAGVKPINIIPKTSLIKKNKPVMQIKITPKISADEGATGKNSQEVLDAFTEELEDSNKTATRAELEAGKVARTEILSLSVFKNYSAGNPTQVLYIKNLAKEVAPEDLFYVFGAFFASLEDAKAALSVKLMQEGRMRGQAFVTFPSAQSAEDALGVLGIKVKIMLDWDPQSKQGPMTPLPDMVTIHTPKGEEFASKPYVGKEVAA